MVVPTKLLLLLIPPVVLGNSYARSDPPIVDLGYAQYQGISNSQTGNTEFLGIRYAAPPTGNARWREPMDPVRVDSLQMADTQPKRCPQAPENADKRIDLPPVITGNVTIYEGGPQQVFASIGGDLQQTKSGMGPMSEDCLFLNVVTPGLNSSSTTAKKLPVVVWIHGGGYALGSISDLGLSSMRKYNGNDLVNGSQGRVIAVLIQYRLGLFGFLAGKDVKRNGALNAGLRDQQFALEWIQKHISKFGGDPDQVTIWGQSAGGGSVLQHMIANGGNTKPALFRGAMLSSTFLPSQYRFNSKIPEGIYAKVVQEAGCEDAEDPLQCLRDTDVSILSEINIKIASQALYGTFTFVPVVDGEFIRESPRKALRKRKLNTENILAVTNTREGRMFVDPGTRGSLDVHEYLSQLFPMLREQQIRLALKKYEHLSDPFEQVVEIMGEAIFVCPTYLIMESLDGKGYKAGFAIPPGDHLDDLLYFFPSLSPVGAPPFNNTGFKSAFSEAFMDFVRNQDPNIKSPESILPHWPKWDGRYREEMVFNRTGDAPDIKTTTTEQTLLERCEFWESVGKWIGQ